MQVKKISIGSVQTKNNVFLAPIAGFSDFAFRDICCKFGAGLTFTEMVSAKGMYYKNEGNADLLRCAKNEELKAVQIFGSDPFIMRSACETDELSKFDVIDINMGCPVPKVFKNGEGSALLNDISLAEKVVKECVKSGKNITLKIRIGLTDDKKVAVDFAKMAEDSGAKMITIHGRTRQHYYSGEIDFDEIRKACESVKIPVIANGGIYCKTDADIMMERTGADGVMLAQGALSKPFLFSEILGKNIPDEFATDGKLDKKKMIFYHLDLLSTVYQDRAVAVNFRKVINNYLKGERNAKELKMKLFKAVSVSEIKRILNENF